MHLDTLRGSIVHQPDWFALYGSTLAPVGSLPASPAAEDRVRVAELASHRLGSPLWASSDRDDFQDRLDAAIGDPVLPAFSTLVDDALHRDDEPPARPAVELLAKALVESLGDAFAERVRAGLALGAAIHDAQQALVAQHPPGVEPPASFDPAALYSPEIPTEVLDAILSGCRAALCFSALADAARAGRSPPAWLAGRVVETWIASQRVYLRLLASFEHAQVPEELVPRAERLDWALLRADLERERSAFEALMARVVGTTPARP